MTTRCATAFPGVHRDYVDLTYEVTKPGSSAGMADVYHAVMGGVIDAFMGHVS